MSQINETVRAVVLQILCRKYFLVTYEIYPLEAFLLCLSSLHEGFVMFVLKPYKILRKTLGDNCSVNPGSKTEINPSLAPKSLARLDAIAPAAFASVHPRA